MHAQLATIPLDQIRLSQTVSQTARRKHFAKEDLAELVESVKAHGVLQPIIVRTLPKVSGKELVAGERRFLAAKSAGLDSIQAVVRELTDEQVIEIQLIENLQREDVHPMQEAEGYHELVSKYGHPIEDVYTRVGKSRSYVYGRMKLLALSEKCRNAFYDAEISASIALLLARIPVEKLQNAALKEICGGEWRTPMSYRQARQHIEEEFMLRLGEAPFPTDDPDLNGGVGPCGTCPKRTGNQPELFADVKGADVCTDPVCFKGKTVAHGNRLMAAAREAGREIIAGPAAKKIAPNGVEHYSYEVRGGYHLLDHEYWAGSQRTSARKLLKPDAATALLQDPETGKVVEVAHESQLKKPKRESGGREESWRKEKREKAAAAKAQTAFRHAVFKAIVEKGKWKAPSMRVVAELMVETLDYDAGEALMDLVGVAKLKSPGFFDRLRQHVNGLKTDAQFEAFVAQAYLAGELHVSSYALSPKMPRLEAAAKFAVVDVAKIRRELAPKKKTKAKRK
jgi:ParB/RepB/Spo0J family partition protein